MRTNRWGEYIFTSQIYSNHILEVELVGVTNPNPEYRMFKNVDPNQKEYDYYVFEYVISGVGYIETKEQKYIVQTGDLYFLNKSRYQIYYSDSEQPFKKQFVVFRGKLADALVNLFNIHDSVIVKQKNAEHTFERLIGNFKGDEVEINAEVEQIIFELFQYIRNQQDVYTTTKKDSALQIEEYLRTHISDKITIDNMCRALYISPSTAQHSFAQRYQCSIMKYLRKIRIENAKILLKETEHSIKSISRMLGFDDEKYFSKSFKQETGIAPSEYRKE